MEENKLSVSDSEELELGSAEGEENVSEATNLENSPSPADTLSEAEYFQKLTGRKDIKTKEDFEKHYQNLKKLVGDQAIAELRKKAEAYDKLQQEIEKEADEFLASEEGQEFAKELEADVEKSEVADLKERLEAIEFLKKHPEAEPYLDVIRSFASYSGTSLEEAYEQRLKDLIDSKLEAEKLKKEERNIGVESKPRLSSSKIAKLSQLVEQIKKAPTDDAKEALVREWLSEE